MGMEVSRLQFNTINALTQSSPAHAAPADRIDLYSDSVGSGPTIIFVHGWTCDTSSWREQVRAFENDYRVITLDLPGHGRSGPPPADRFSMDLFARAVEAVRAEAGARKVVLIGHSMGVIVIRQFAIMFPDRVAGLVAVDGPIDLRELDAFGNPEPAQFTREARETLIRGMFVPETPVALQQQILSMMLAAPEATAIGAGMAIFDPVIRTADVISVPVLLVVAGTAKVPDTAALRDLLPHLEATQVAQTGHFLMMEKPEQFNGLLATFLDRIDF